MNDCAATCSGGTFPAVTCDSGSSCGCDSCQLDDGESCDNASQCLSGFCPAKDDVCCDVACDQTCEACLASKTGGTDGACDDVIANTDPDGDCQGALTCDGSGACGLKQDGESCSQGAECQSGNCPTQDGVCCDNACSGTCESCLGANTTGNDGQCLPVVSGADPNNECAGASSLRRRRFVLVAAGWRAVQHRQRLHERQLPRLGQGVLRHALQRASVRPARSARPAP